MRPPSRATSAVAIRLLRPSAGRPFSTTRWMTAEASDGRAGSICVGMASPGRVQHRWLRCAARYAGHVLRRRHAATRSLLQPFTVAMNSVDMGECVANGVDDRGHDRIGQLAEAIVNP